MFNNTHFKDLDFNDTSYCVLTRGIFFNNMHFKDLDFNDPGPLRFKVPGNQCQQVDLTGGG